MTEIEKIKSQIAGADFPAAIQALKLLTKNSLGSNDLLQLEARFNQNEKAHHRHGTLSLAEYNLERNKVSKALLDICSELEMVQKSPSKEAKAPFPSAAPPMGYCIRTKQRIPFNIDKPLSFDAFMVWEQFEDEDYPEKYCHFSGEPSNGETSFSKPVLKKNWKKAREVHGF